MWPNNDYYYYSLFDDSDDKDMPLSKVELSLEQKRLVRIKPNAGCWWASSLIKQPVIHRQ